VAPSANDLHSQRPLPHPHRPSAAVITDARGAASEELAVRMRRYGLAMGFRMACFLGMVFVDGWLRWTLLAFAVFLPYVAVVLANQSDQRTRPNQVEHGAPQEAPELTSGTEAVVIEGELVDDAAGDEQVRPAA
jgi:hypothetical protein